MWRHLCIAENGQLRRLALWALDPPVTYLSFQIGKHGVELLFARRSRDDRQIAASQRINERNAVTRLEHSTHENYIPFRNDHAAHYHAAVDGW